MRRVGALPDADVLRVVRGSGAGTRRDSGAFSVDQRLLGLPILGYQSTIGKTEGIIDREILLEEIDRACLLPLIELVRGEAGVDGDDAQRLQCAVAESDREGLRIEPGVRDAARRSSPAPAPAQSRPLSRQQNRSNAAGLRPATAATGRRRWRADGSLLRPVERSESPHPHSARGAPGRSGSAYRS